LSLPLVPDNLVETRDALHQVAFFALSPARYAATGRMGLTATNRGFGTPKFEGRVARVEEDLVIHEQGGNISSQAITTIRAASEFLGQEYEEHWFADFRDPLRPVDPDGALQIDRGASEFLGAWFQFGVKTLNQLRGHGSDLDDVSEVQLWPEHFDPSIEMGDFGLGQRASYGASPGDPHHPEPYVYVSSRSEVDRSNAYWNASTFNGASLHYQEIMDTTDPTGRALEFLLEGYRILHGG
jgi:hypothetical protein